MGAKLNKINYSEFGTRICQCRKKAKLSQHALADQLGISYQHMSNIECGSAKPSLELVVKIATILDVDLNLLVGKTTKIYTQAINQAFFELLKNASNDDIQICYSLCEAYLKASGKKDR